MYQFLLKRFNHVWLVLAAVVMALLLLFPDWLSRENVAVFLEGFGTGALLVYVLVSLTRALLFIPCTPFVLAGAISFPQWPLLVLLVSIAGIVAGATLIYSFPSFGGYDRFLQNKYPDKINLLKKQLHGKYAFWIVAGWSFFPLVPTDAVCYVAGIVKMPYRKMIRALVIGEFPLVLIYVLLGIEVGEWLRP